MHVELLPVIWQLQETTHRVQELYDKWKLTSASDKMEKDKIKYDTGITQ